MRGRPSATGFSAGKESAAGAGGDSAGGLNGVPKLCGHDWFIFNS
jgi:hypothetical protein